MPNFIITAVLLYAVLPGIIARATGPRKLYNLHARYDYRENIIYVEWKAKSETDFELRYRLNTSADNDNNNNNWQVASTHRYEGDGYSAEEDSNGGNTSFYSRLRADTFGNNDELFVQVKPSSSSDWSETLIISIAKRSPDTTSDFFNANEVELKPPRNFTANVLAADAIQLEWAPSESELSTADLYYMVDIRQTTANDPSHRPIEKQIKVKSDNFLLGDLTPGEHYELTIRSATSASRVSSTAAIVDIDLPRKEEFFEVGNLIISSRFKTDGSGTVNLTWETPAALRGKIVAYDLQYAEKRADISPLWQRALFIGDSPTVLLNDLKSDTEYLLTITTRLISGLETKSGQFRFRTPHVPANPIDRLNVIHSSETSAVRLQWTLASHINPLRVAGYDVSIADDKDAAEELWRRVLTTPPTALPDAIPVMAAAAEVVLDDLKPAHEYYAKIKVRLTDNTTIDAPLVYRFTSTNDAGLADVDPRVRRAERPFQTPTAASGGRMRITWSYAAHIINDIAGARIFYSDQPTAPIHLWQVIDVADSIQREVVLTNLHPDTVYFVQIVPLRRSDGSLDFVNAEGLQVRTD